MARRRGRHGFKIPVISLAILGAQIVWAAEGGNLQASLGRFALLYTGFDANANFAFYPKYLAAGYGPWIAKRFIGAIARPRMPIHGLPISLS